MPFLIYLYITNLRTLQFYRAKNTITLVFAFILVLIKVTFTTAPGIQWVHISARAEGATGGQCLLIAIHERL